MISCASRSLASPRTISLPSRDFPWKSRKFGEPFDLKKKVGRQLSFDQSQAGTTFDQSGEPAVCGSIRQGYEMRSSYWLGGQGEELQMFASVELFEMRQLEVANCSPPKLQKKQ